MDITARANVNTCASSSNTSEPYDKCVLMGGHIVMEESHTLRNSHVRSEVVKQIERYMCRADELVCNETQVCFII